MSTTSPPGSRVPPPADPPATPPRRDAGDASPAPVAAAEDPGSPARASRGPRASSRVSSPASARIREDAVVDDEEDDPLPPLPLPDSTADGDVAPSRTALRVSIPMPPAGPSASPPGSSSGGERASEGRGGGGRASASASAASASASASASARAGPSSNSIFSNGPKSTSYPGEASRGSQGESSRVESLRRLFKLPDGEPLVEEFLCALYKKILLQGRMYLFADHVCFYSNVFGYVKIKTIALRDVTIVNRAYTVQVFPNAVEIVHKGKCEFFTSFIFPDMAYKKIVAAWRRASPYGKIFAAHDAHKIRAARADAGTLEPDLGASGPTPEVAAMLGLKEEGNEQEAEEEGNEPSSEKASPALGPVAASRSRRRASAPARQASAPNLAARHRASPAREGEGGEPEPEREPASGPNSLGGVSSLGSPEEEEEEEEEEEDSEDEDLQKNDPRKSAADAPDVISRAGRAPGAPSVPRRPDDMQTLAQQTLRCSVDAYFALAWSDAAATGAFGNASRARRGERDARTTKWRRHRHHGHARDLTFVAPTNASLGPRETNCHQTQTYHACVGGALVVDTSQVQTDIPYGDYFRVESRWEITPAGDDACVAWVGLRIPFQRSTMLRKVIEQSALEESRKSVEQALALAAAMIERSDGGGVVPRGGSVGEDAEETGGGRDGGGPTAAREEAAAAADPGATDPSGGAPVVDVSKLNIPEGSRDVVWRMLFGNDGEGDAAKRRSSLGGDGGRAETPKRSPKRSEDPREKTSPLGGEATPETSSVEGLRSPSGGGGGGGGGGGSVARKGRRWTTTLLVDEADASSTLGGVFGAPRSGDGLRLGAAALALAVVVVLAAAAWASFFGSRFSFSFSDGGDTPGADAGYWRRRAAALEAELKSLERRAAFVAEEAAHARASAAALSE